MKYKKGNYQIMINGCLMVLLLLCGNILADRPDKNFNLNRNLIKALKSKKFTGLKIVKHTDYLKNAGKAQLNETNFAPMLDEINKTQEKGLKFSVKKIRKNRQGKIRIRLKQHYKDIPIFGAEIVFHCNEGECDTVTGKFIEQMNLSVHPEISPDEVFDIILEGNSFANRDSRPLDEPELIIIGGKLAYSLTVTFESEENRGLQIYKYYVDAKTGEIIFKNNKKHS